MTLSGLRVVGLSDWPNWYRVLNPGYFASGNENRKTRSSACAGESCCATHASNAILVQKGAQKLKSSAPASDGKGLGASEKTGTEEQTSGQQTLVRLRNMQQESEGRVSSGKKDHVTKNVMLGMVAVKDTKDWEDESGSDDDSKMIESKGAVTKEKLVDV